MRRFLSSAGVEWRGHPGNEGVVIARVPASYRDRFAYERAVQEDTKVTVGPRR